MSRFSPVLCRSLPPRRLPCGLPSLVGRSLHIRGFFLSVLFFLRACGLRGSVCFIYIEKIFICMGYKIVMIEWLDVASFEMIGLGEVEDLAGVEPPTACIVGFLVKETDSCYFIAKEFWSTGQFKYVHIFPKNTAIVKVEYLSVSETQKN